MDIIEVLSQYEPQSFHHETSVVWEKAEGYYVWDREGKRYLDFTSGIFVANIGHRHPRVVEAIKEQSEKMLYNYAFPSEVRAKLVKKLCEMTGFEKCFLCSTGSEAIEAAIRCMGGDPDGIIGMNGAFHGNTYGSKSVCRDIHYSIFPPLGLFDGLLFESYFGYNAQFHPKEWIQEWCNWTQGKGIPVCFDEVQAGFGRTGKLFGYEWYDVKPDMIVVGKALGGGLPISAILGSAKLLDTPDDLSSTHSGNALCCAAALATLEVIEEEQLIEKAAQNEWIGNELKYTYPFLVNGHGMIWGIDLEDVDFANKVVDECAERGLLLVKTHKGTIKIGPPLTMPPEIIEKGLQIIKGVIYENKTYRNSGQVYALNAQIL